MVLINQKRQKVKIKKLICPKCGNTENFRVDVQLSYVSTLLSFDKDNEAELDTDFPTDVDIMCPVCNVCGTELDLSITEPDVLCPSCLHYVEGDVIETCPLKKRNYPKCFMWSEEAELDI